ncbi:MAG: hypothetical protein COA91_12410 [Robiginitomaculum sp.]|nr:MAG: hypothetical protein COA91_12410 [Robiginitomaculum sp.]
MDFIPEGSMWLLYLVLFIGPFVQEDTAVIGAASLSLSSSQPWLLIYVTVLAGLITSDSWKYWLGWAAKHHSWAKKFGQRPRVTKMKHAVLNNAVKTLITVRFLPMARIAAYMATGFFGVSYLKYWLSITFSGFLFVSTFFLAFHLLGELVGEQIKRYLPFVALGLVGTVLMVLFFHRRFGERGQH